MKSSPLPKPFSCTLVLFCLLFALDGCNDNSDPSLIARTQFVNSNLTVAENDGEQIIALSLDRPALLDGEVIVTASSVVPACYSTSPVLELGQMKIKVSKGDTRKAFKMTPTDNSNLDGVKLVKFKISSVSEGMTIGTTTEMIVSVTDDEEEAEAGFESTELRVRENDPAATRIEIIFTHATAADGVLVVDLRSIATYGVEYTTQPQAASGKIFLQVPKGASSAFINLFAINDNAFKPDRNITFTISDATGGVSIGKNDTFTCTITDDDGAQLTDLVTIRSLYIGSTQVIKKDTYVEGVVTSVNNTLGGRVVIQDATGALPIQFLTDELPKRGDVILVNLFSASLRELQGTLEVGPVAAYETIGRDIYTVTKMSLSEAMSLGKRIESTTIQLTGVSFTQANGTLTMRGDRLLTDGSKTIIVRTGTSANFGDDLVPVGDITVTGIFTKNDGLYVIYPQESKDIRKQGFTPIRDGLVKNPR